MQSIGERLRELRTAWAPLTQGQLARGISEGPKPYSLSTISAWETGRLIPGDDQLALYARFFASRRSTAGERAAIIAQEALTPEERARCDGLLSELMELRDPPGQSTGRGPLGGKMFYFPDGEDVCIVASKLPADEVESIQYARPGHPNYVDMLTYADADAVVEIFGHVRAENPRSTVTFGTWDTIRNDQLAQHLIVLGGDWNRTYAWAARRFEIPLLFTVDDGGDGELDGYFVVGNEGDQRELRPTLIGGQRGNSLPELEYDVAMFARGPNPANTRMTLTLCQGVFSRGTYGAVRAFTDAAQREANEAEVEALSPGFGGEHLEWLMFRVQVAFGRALTPDLSRDYQRLAYGVQESMDGGGIVSKIRWLEGSHNVARVGHRT